MRFPTGGDDPRDGFEPASRVAADLVRIQGRRYSPDGRRAYIGSIHAALHVFFAGRRLRLQGVGGLVFERRDIGYMRLALRLARKGLGGTSPNPAVGAVLVSPGDAIVGRGYHKRAGCPHAEAEALAEAGRAARGATLYVNLEPCSHHGRTPPCAEALVEHGVAKVFFSIRDPNPLVSGRGAAILRGAGVEVAEGLLAAEAARLNEAFIKFIATGLPFVTMKSAMTMDGKIATAGGNSKWITGDKARRYVHLLRSRSDAVLVGVGTVLADDPLLTVRLVKAGRDPLRVVVDSTARTPADARLLKTGAPPLIAVTSRADPAKRDALAAAGAKVAVLPADDDGRVDLASLCAYLGRQGITSVLVEGGGKVASSALKAGVVDKILVFVAPKMVGGNGPGPVSETLADTVNEAVPLTAPSVRRFGPDVLLTAYMRR